MREEVKGKGIYDNRRRFFNKSRWLDELLFGWKKKF